MNQALRISSFVRCGMGCIFILFILFTNDNCVSDQDVGFNRSSQRVFVERAVKSYCTPHHLMAISNWINACIYSFFHPSRRDLKSRYTRSKSPRSPESDAYKPWIPRSASRSKRTPVQRAFVAIARRLLARKEKNHHSLQESGDVGISVP